LHALADAHLGGRLVGDPAHQADAFVQVDQADVVVAALGIGLRRTVVTA
jgi:hypothetical protein